MSLALLLIHDPILNDYGKFFSKALNRVPRDASGIEVLVGNNVHNTGELNQILRTLYPQIRDIATSLGFTYKFEIDILVNSRVTFDKRQIYCPETEKANFEKTSVEYVTAELGKLDKHNKVEEGIKYKGVITSAVGGTFDHLHDGHKILLLMTAFTASKSIIIGVTGPKLLVKKKFADFMEPLHVRVMKVCNFLQKIVSPEITFQIYQINDVCGPTGFVKEIDALIISEETVKGAEFVNNYRKERQFPPLHIVTVEVIGGDGSGNASNNWKGKLSSTDLREVEYKNLHIQ